MATAAVRDPIAFELFKNSLTAIADEMALTIFRTTYSGVLKNGMDYSTAFCDARGQTVAQGLTQAGHLGAIPTAMASVMRHFGDHMQPGDVYCLNDPFDGGMHLPDIFVFKPIFYQGERLAIAATICHHTDVGGRVAGSNASDSTEVYAEGLRIPVLKLYDAGRPNETLLKFIEKNVRLPVRVLGDLRAQLAACHIAEVEFLRLVDQYGASTVELYMQELLDYTERLTRAAIRELPDGEFAFEDWIDDDGIDYRKPIPLRVRLRKDGDRLVADWSGSSPQVKGAINSTLSYTKAATYTCVKSVLTAEIPNNEGFYRAIEVLAPPGTIVNCVLPAATAARALTAFRVVDCCYGALAMMLPDRVFAASEGGNTGITIGGYYADRRPFIYVDFLCSAWGARPWADGPSGNANMFSNLSLQPAEVCELENPIEIVTCELIQDVMGAGRWRGGASLRRDYRFLEEEAILQVRADRCTFRAYGLYAGRPGRLGVNVLNPETERRVLPGKLTMTIRHGDVLRHEMPGPGGWGDPLDREPWRVLRDVRNEFVSLESARDDYGVVIDPAAWTVDSIATAELRVQLRAARSWLEPPKVLR
ncbi:MAG: hydantoinase B/oxoprolinase family protein [Chloroflexi bacterium]|nr:hydantoinase B/oxoprolinase family protein [Chloroflexota bacterium]